VAEYDITVQRRLRCESTDHPQIELHSVQHHGRSNAPFATRSPMTRTADSWWVWRARTTAQVN